MAKGLYIIAGANDCGKITFMEPILQGKHLKFLNVNGIAHEISPNAIGKAPITTEKKYIKYLKLF